MPESNDPTRDSYNSEMVKEYLSQNPASNKHTLSYADKIAYIIAAINAFNDGRLHLAKSESDRAMHNEHAKQAISMLTPGVEGGVIDIHIPQANERPAVQAEGHPAWIVKPDAEVGFVARNFMHPWVVGHGDTEEAAIKMAQENMESITCQNCGAVDGETGNQSLPKMQQAAQAASGDESVVYAMLEAYELDEGNIRSQMTAVLVVARRAVLAEVECAVRAGYLESLKPRLNQWNEQDFAGFVRARLSKPSSGEESVDGILLNAMCTAYGDYSAEGLRKMTAALAVARRAVLAEVGAALTEVETEMYGGGTAYAHAVRARLSTTETTKTRESEGRK